MAKELPDEVYVFANASDDEEWLEVEETAEACAEKGEKRLVGVYVLQHRCSVSLEVKEELIIKKIDS